METLFNGRYETSELPMVSKITTKSLVVSNCTNYTTFCLKAMVVAMQQNRTYFTDLPYSLFSHRYDSQLLPPTNVDEKLKITH